MIRSVLVAVCVCLSVASAASSESVAFFRAIHKRDVSTARELLARDRALVHATGDDKITPLGIAALNNDVPMATLFIDSGADLEAVEPQRSWTPLLLAVFHNSVTVAELLLKRGASAKVRDKDGHSALKSAVRHNAVPMLKLLLQYGASVDSGHLDGTALFVASQEGYLDIVKYLLSKGASPNLVRRDGMLPLHQALLRGNVAVAPALLEAGADPDATVTDQNTAMHIVAQQRLLGAAELLLRHNASLVMHRSDGGTPLHAAAASGAADIVSLFLEHGADVDVRSAVDDATPLRWAVIKRKLDTAKVLLANKASTESRSAPHNDTALIAAAKEDDPRMVTLLLRYNAAVDATDSYRGATALHAAAENNFMDVAQKLVDAGASVEARSRSGATCVSVASERGHHDMAKMLSEYEGVGERSPPPSSASVSKEVSPGDDNLNTVDTGETEAGSAGSPTAPSSASPSRPSTHSFSPSDAPKQSQDTTEAKDAGTTNYVPVGTALCVIGLGVAAKWLWNVRKESDRQRREKERVRAQAERDWQSDFEQKDQLEQERDVIELVETNRSVSRLETALMCNHTLARTRTWDGEPVLHVAARKNFEDMARTLLLAGANAPPLENSHGHVAADVAHPDLQWLFRGRTGGPSRALAPVDASSRSVSDSHGTLRGSASVDAASAVSGSQRTGPPASEALTTGTRGFDEEAAMTAPAPDLPWPSPAADGVDDGAA